MLGILKAAISAFVKYPKGEAEARLSGFRSLMVSHGEPSLLELSRAGRLFNGGTTAVANARAPVTDIPTTTANWLLYNPANNPRCLVIIAAGVFLGSGTADTGVMLIGGTTALKLTDANSVVANATGHAIASTRGSGNASRAFLGVGATIPTSAPQYVTIAGMQNQASTTPGNGVVGQVNGFGVVPPGYGFAVDVLSGVGTTAKYGINLLFAELELDLD